jgi:ketosteroid isomerase-like protein
MSRENVEVVRAAIDALNRGDADAAFKDMAPDFEYDFSRSIGFQPGVYKLDEARRIWEEFVGTWESARWEADEFIEADEHVVTPLTTSVRGRDGIEVQALRTAWVWTFRDGNVARITFYQERQEALEAAGLSE